MKIAIFIYGEFREFDTVIKYWDFLEKFDNDIYLSTWDYSLQINNKLGIRRERTVTDEMIKSVLPNSNYSILKESDYFEDYQNISIKNRAWRVSMHWKNCLRMMKESGKVYDFIMLTRTDNYTIFELTEEQLSKLNRVDAIYGLSSIYLYKPKSYFVQDMFFLGDSNIMSNLIDNLPLNLSSLHDGLSEHIINSNLYVEPIGCVNVTPYRPNCLNKNFPINFDSICDKHREWHSTEKE